MQVHKQLTVIGTIFVLSALLVAGLTVSTSAAAAGSCDAAFFNGLGLSNVTFASPSPAYNVRNPGVRPLSTPVSHCEVIGYIDPRTGIDGKLYAIGFHLRLPDAWNGRFYFEGGGGTDGNLGNATGGGALTSGYAVVSTDAGHDNTIDNDANAGGTATFGVDPQARIDYGYNALDKVTETAKTLISDYYGQDIAYSYFVGCSNGGRQGMVASQRFPTYFDGIVAGAPGFNLPRAAMAGAWNGQALAPLATKLSTQNQPYLPDTFTDADLTLAANAILAACDALDGLTDGIVGNYPACTNELVYPQLKKIQCTGAKDASCLSADQIAALKKIYAGPANSQGQALYSDWQWDGGIAGSASLRGWSLGTIAAPGKPLVNNASKITLGAGSLALVFVTPPVIIPTNTFESFAFHFNFDTDAPKIYETFGPYTQSSMEFMSAHATDLSPLKNHGSKMILYQGGSDGSFSPRDTMNWYKQMNSTMGGTAKDFARFFFVPGMGHCSGGPGTTSFDTLAPIVNWVEQGVAPETILAKAPNNTPWPNRTRPLCPYPEVTAYDGTGDIEVAASFSCVPPINIRIEPGNLNLKSKGEFTAFITLPEGYDVKDWNIGNISCGGATATKSMVSDNMYIAKFRRQDLKDVSPGQSVILTVQATFQHEGKEAIIQGIGTVNVTE